MRSCKSQIDVGTQLVRCTVLAEDLRQVALSHSLYLSHSLSFYLSLPLPLFLSLIFSLSPSLSPPLARSLFLFDVAMLTDLVRCTVLAEDLRQVTSHEFRQDRPSHLI